MIRPIREQGAAAVAAAGLPGVAVVAAAGPPRLGAVEHEVHPPCTEAWSRESHRVDTSAYTRS